MLFLSHKNSYSLRLLTNLCFTALQTKLEKQWASEFQSSFWCQNYQLCDCTDFVQAWGWKSHHNCRAEVRGGKFSEFSCPWTENAPSCIVELCKRRRTTWTASTSEPFWSCWFCLFWLIESMTNVTMTGRDGRWCITICEESILTSFQYLNSWASFHQRRFDSVKFITLLTPWAHVKVFCL